MARRLSAQQERKIVDAYAAWDPGAVSMEELLARVGVSRQTVYTVLRRHGIDLKSGRSHTGPSVSALVAEHQATLEGLDRALSAVLDRLEACRSEGTALKALARSLMAGEPLSEEQRALAERIR